jgi:hypothetical protein
LGHAHKGAVALADEVVADNGCHSQPPVVLELSTDGLWTGRLQIGTRTAI